LVFAMLLGLGSKGPPDQRCRRRFTTGLGRIFPRKQTGPFVAGQFTFARWCRNDGTVSFGPSSTCAVPSEGPLREVSRFKALMTPIRANLVEPPDVATQAKSG
jgi:hypothetical protein